MLTAHELALQQTTQSSDYDGVPGMRQTSLELRRSDRAVSESAHDRDHPILGEQLQRAQPQLVSFGHTSADPPRLHELPPAHEVNLDVRGVSARRHLTGADRNRHHGEPGNCNQDKDH